MVIAGLTNNCLWFTYGILSDNWFIISPNIVFISLNSFTLVLCVVFNPTTHPLPDDFHIQGDDERESSQVLDVDRASKVSLSCKGDNNLPSPAFEALHSPLEAIQSTACSSYRLDYVGTLDLEVILVFSVILEFVKQHQVQMTTDTAVLVIKTMAACSATVMLCSPAILMYQIFKKKNLGVASVIPLITLLANSHVWALYGYLIENWFPIFWIYVFGDAITLLYLAIYWRYSKQRRYVNRVLLIMISVLTIVTLYTIIGGLGYTNQTRDNMGSVIGIVADVFAICLYAAPMEKLFQVLKYRSAVFINAHMVIAGLTNNCLWFTYGILSDNWFIISPNIVFISLNSFTLVLCVVFNPKTHPLPDDFYIHCDDEGEIFPTTTVDHMSCKADNEFPSPAFEALPLNSIQTST
ncbi:Hypothetical protein PHPALM_5166 [Phytophthora palmivora]|uniref:MtN3-like protein n=1 Tax=Phytophthora palmivora TaxID=4796 RepID=A0A2P4YI20_9STRA|nr:Hypothetical protein PHPALM_5166 [Phytophthora palmivora]